MACLCIRDPYTYLLHVLALLACGWVAEWGSRFSWVRRLHWESRCRGLARQPGLVFSAHHVRQRWTLLIHAF